MKKIEADLKYYNANSRDVHTGDCVKRGLSVAYSMDYDQVSAELNRIKRRYGYSRVNIGPVFEKFMSARGDVLTRVPESEQITADEFCKEHPTGAYVILLGEKLENPSSHLAAVVNGDVYDSWYSLDWYVKSYTKVSQGKSDVYEINREDGLEAAKQVAASVDEYIKSNLSKKVPDCMKIHLQPSVEQDNKYTYEICIRCKFGKVPKYARWWDDGTIGHIIIMKFNPRMSMEENISSLTKKCKQKAYDWVYNVKAEIQDAIKLEEIGISKYYHYNTRTADAMLAKLPDWVIPRVEQIYDKGDNYDYDRFYVVIDALEGDPRYDECDYVEFNVNSLTELKQHLALYKEDYSREGYDY